MNRHTKGGAAHGAGGQAAFPAGYGRHAVSGRPPFRQGSGVPVPRPAHRRPLSVPDQQLLPRRGGLHGKALPHGHPHRAGGLPHLRGRRHRPSPPLPRGRKVLRVRHPRVLRAASNRRHPRYRPAGGRRGHPAVRLRSGTDVPEAGGRLHPAEPRRHVAGHQPRLGLPHVVRLRPRLRQRLPHADHRHRPQAPVSGQAPARHGRAGPVPHRLFAGAGRHDRRPALHRCGLRHQRRHRQHLRPVRRGHGGGHRSIRHPSHVDLF